jgi:hypothetical protein
VKYPEPGSVKTRLDLDAQSAAGLYRCFVEDTVSAFEKGDYSFRIAFHPPPAEEKTVKWLGKGRSFFQQEGDDLGQRLKNSFKRVFSGGVEEAAVMGSDSPDLPPDFVRDALDSLGEFDAVVGPSQDGGYYLIGFRKEAFYPAALEGIEWSTNTVFEKTLLKLTEAGRTVRVLPYWRDVDTASDLLDLVSRNRNTPFSASKTMAWLRGKGYAH